MTTTRIEHDLPGDRDVPADRYFGIHTLRAVENFAITGITIAHDPRLIKSLAYIKKAAALTNQELARTCRGDLSRLPFRSVTNIRPQRDAILVASKTNSSSQAKSYCPRTGS